jgi:hypothetical protein
VLIGQFFKMSAARNSSSTASTEPEPNAQLEQEVKEEEEQAALEAIENASEKELLVKAGSSAKERRGK